jgi:hypothetical protein
VKSFQEMKRHREHGVGVDALEAERVSRDDVERIKRALKEKQNWKQKVVDPDIVCHYRTEALEQGASKDTFDVAIRELVAEAVLEGVAHTLEMPETNDKYDSDYTLGTQSTKQTFFFVFVFLTVEY